MMGWNAVDFHRASRDFIQKNWDKLLDDGDVVAYRRRRCRTSYVLYCRLRGEWKRHGSGDWEMETGAIWKRDSGRYGERRIRSRQ